MGCGGGSSDSMLAAEDVTRRYGTWRPPDEDKAMLHHRAEHSHHDFFDVSSSRVRDLKEFGVGHMMYFYFLFWMAALFGVLSVITALPNMVLNYSGKFYDTGQIELTSLGNFGRVSVAHNNDGAVLLYKNVTTEGWERELLTSNTFMADAALPPATQPFDKKAAIIAMSVLDCFGVVLYFVVTLGLILVARKLAHDADMHTATIHDYSVLVRRLPQDATTEELVEFFGQYGEVVHVEVVRAYGRLVHLVLQRGQLLRQLQCTTAALQKDAQTYEDVPASREEACYKIKSKIDAVSDGVQVEQAQADSHRVVGAFVTFKTEVGKQACLKAQPHSRMRQWWSLKAEHKLRSRHALWITDSPEPSDVQYENMEHDAFERFLRAALVTGCSYTGLAAGFALISLASALRFNLANIAGVDQSLCSTSCRLTDANGVLMLTTEDRELYKSCAASGTTPSGNACSDVEKMCYKCFCFTAVGEGMLSEGLYCSGIANLVVLQASSQGLIVVAILAINFLLAFTSRKLTVFEKHHTRSSEARSLAHKLFLAQFLNSALSTIIANAHLPFLSNLLDGTAAGGIFFQGIYTDLTPNWYKVVGRSLVISQLVAAVLRAVNLLVKWLWMKWALWHKGQCLTQHELQESLRGPEFELDQRYGEHLNVIYVSLLLSGGLPISYLAAAVWFLSAYWCDKLELLSLSRRPVTYGSDLSNMVLNLLPFAAVWHVAFAVWAFSIFGVPRSPIITDAFASFVLRICTGMSRVWASTSSMAAEQAAQRLLAANSAHLLVLLIVLVGVLLLKLYFTTGLKAGRWLLSMIGVIEDKEEAEVNGLPEFPVAVRTQLLVGETTYAIQSQPAYAAAFTKTEDAVEDVLVQVVMRRGAEKLAGRGAKDKLRQLSPRSAAGPLAAGPTSPTASYENSQGEAAAAARVSGSVVAADAAGSGPAQQQQQLVMQDEVDGDAVWDPLRQQQWGQDGGLAAEEYARQLQQQPQRQSRPSGSSRDGRNMRSMDGSGSHAAAATTSGGSRGGAPERMALPQKYRQARANQVLPMAPEYLAAARAGKLVPSAADQSNG